MKVIGEVRDILLRAGGDKEHIFFVDPQPSLIFPSNKSKDVRMVRSTHSYWK
jgi:hypothetical protein